MNDKNQLLDMLSSALAAGTISNAEVLAILHQPVAPPTPFAEKTASSQKLSAVELIFYIAGIVMFVALMSLIVQSWDEVHILTNILISAGCGGGMWSLAYYLHRQNVTSDIRKGLENSLVLTGSLSIIVGCFIIADRLAGGPDLSLTNYYAATVTLAILGLLHVAYDRIVRKELLILLALVLSVAAFPTLLYGILQNSNLSVDFWSCVSIGSWQLLAFSSRVMARIDPSRHHLSKVFDPLVAFASLATMFLASFGDYGIIWLSLMIISVFGMLYISILKRSKHLLGNASFFLVVAIITVSFKYFSQMGVSVSLIIASAGLLGTAAIAASINKKYFKVSNVKTVDPS